MRQSDFICRCRGKISEGIDFADDAARIVITIGIPYPAATDPVTKAKKDYNDLICKTTTKNAINGHRWYEIQAFRAINQENRDLKCCTASAVFQEYLFL